MGIFLAVSEVYFNFRFSVASAAIPVMSMEFASLCLKNALSLLPEDPVAASSPVPSGEETADGRWVAPVIGMSSCISTAMFRDWIVKCLAFEGCCRTVLRWAGQEPFICSQGWKSFDSTAVLGWLDSCLGECRSSYALADAEQRIVSIVRLSKLAWYSMVDSSENNCCSPFPKDTCQTAQRWLK